MHYDLTPDGIDSINCDEPYINQLDRLRTLHVENNGTFVILDDRDKIRDIASFLANNHHTQWRMLNRVFVEISARECRITIAEGIVYISDDDDTNAEFCDRFG